MSEKPTNPKDSVGCQKTPFSFIPAPVLAELGIGLMEGAAKYGAHNWRVMGVRYSIYFDATLRHLFSFWEGEDIDPDSGLSHVAKAIASLVVLRDAMISGSGNTDDRPIRPSDGQWMEKLNASAKKLSERYPKPKERHTELEFKEAKQSMAWKTGAFVMWHGPDDLPDCECGDNVLVVLAENPRPRLIVLCAEERGWSCCDDAYSGYWPSDGIAWAYEREVCAAGMTKTPSADELFPSPPKKDS